MNTSAPYEPYPDALTQGLAKRKEFQEVGCGVSLDASRAVNINHPFPESPSHTNFYTISG
ncbi:hypothetical protein EAE99_010055 [Botrytis elliptica]|nr:hypothetical protein EAE99_010055 [Botrytis elliptica]